MYISFCDQNLFALVCCISVFELNPLAKQKFEKVVDSKPRRNVGPYTFRFKFTVIGKDMKIITYGI